MWNSDCDAQGKFIQVLLEAIRDLGDYMLGQEMIPQVVKLSCGKGMGVMKRKL